MLAGALVLLTGCRKLVSLAVGDAGAPAAPAIPATTAPPESASAGAPIAECEEYATRMHGCVGALSPEVRAATQDTFDKMRQQFRDGARDPMSRAVMAAMCKQLLEDLKKNPQCN